MSFLDSAKFPEMRSLGKSPFVGHSVTLTFGSNGPGSYEEEPGWEDKEWWPRLDQLLEWFGKDIWYLTLNFRGSDYWEGPRLKHKLDMFFSVELFQHAPNLRKLSIHGFINHDDEYYDIMDEDAVRPVVPPAVGEEFVVLGAQLESLECTLFCMYGGDEVIDALFERHRLQLKKASNREKIYLPGLEWPNLTELHLNSVVVQRRYQKNLRNLRVPHLKKLTFGMDGLGLEPDFHFSFPTLIRLLNGLSTRTQLSALRLVGLGPNDRFSRDRNYQMGAAIAPKSLKTLEIVDPYESEPYKPPYYNILLRRFPFLENLHVILTTNMGEGWKIVNPSSEVEVLLPRPREKLRWIHEDEYDDEYYGKEEEILDINKFILKGAMYESNIWELMPFLKVFTFQWDVYTRDGYEEYLRKKTSQEN